MLAPAIAFVDLETTGCDAAVDRICEVAVHRIEPGGNAIRWSSLVQPRVPVGPSARIHGISDEDLAGSGSGSQ